MPTNYNISERLIQFSVAIINVEKHILKSIAGSHLANQLIRSGTSAALNYAESIDSESHRDFIHKIKISLKELRETHVCLQILYKSKNINHLPSVESLISENNELISILVSSIKTLKRKS